MKYRLPAFPIALLASNIYGRDTGYALECVGVESMQKQIVGFLETEVDKIVNLSEMKSLKAVVIRMGNADTLVHMKCANWGPKGTNK